MHINYYRLHCNGGGNRLDVGVWHYETSNLLLVLFIQINNVNPVFLQIARILFLSVVNFIALYLVTFGDNANKT